MQPSGWDLPILAGPPGFDRDEVSRALSLLLDPLEAHVLQAPPHWAVVPVLPALPVLGEVLEELSRGEAVYWSLNPVSPEFLRSGRSSFNNKDILKRRWLLVDIDAGKSLEGKCSSTDLEKGKTLELLGLVVEHLIGKGWPVPVTIDSGNGAHGLWRVDLPNEDAARDLLKRILRRLAAEVKVDGAKIDTSVIDAKRVSKLPGTWVRKGPDTAERPHRIARLLYVPEVLDVVPGGLLEAEAGIADPVPLNGPSTFDPWSLPVGQSGSREQGYARSALERELGILATTRTGRNDRLNIAAFKLGGFVGAGYLAEDEVRSRLAEVARLIGLGTDGDPGEIDRAINNGLEAGRINPRIIPGPLPPTSANGTANGTPIDVPPRIVVWASEITPREVSWLWPDKIPLKKLTTWAGWGGVGKSFVSMDLAARISVGDEIPGGNGLCFNPGNVLILNSEDDPEDTSVPRLIEAGGDLRRVAFLRSEVLGRFTLSDIRTLDLALAQMGGASLVVIDPVTSHLGTVRDSNNAEVQALLVPLSLWAMTRECAVILVSHVNKPSAAKLEAMARICGSVAWVNKVRSAAMFCKDPGDKSRRLFIPFKANNAPESRGLAYRIVTAGTIARVEWLGEVDITADEAMQRKAGPAPERSQDEVNLWLKLHFAERVRVPSAEIFDAQKREGISECALRRAKEVLAIKPWKGETPEGEICWYWIAP